MGGGGGGGKLGITVEGLIYGITDAAYSRTVFASVGSANQMKKFRW